MTDETLVLVLGSFMVAAALLYTLWWQRRRKQIPEIVSAPIFDFPPPPKAIHGYEQKTGPLTGRTRLVARYRIEGDATFAPSEYPEKPPLVSLMIERKGNRWGGTGKQQWYRLYGAPINPCQIGEGVLDLELKPENFGGVMGNKVSQEQLDDVLANAAYIHICFGHSSGREHGVIATGSARFTLLSLEGI